MSPAGALSLLILLTGTAIPAAAQPAGALSCPPGAIPVRPGQSLLQAVEKAGPGASFCIGTGLHRLQSVEPRAGQRFFGEPGAILNGARILSQFEPVDGVWIAGGQAQTGIARGICATGFEACAQAIGVFADGVPLHQVAQRALLRPGAFFHDRPGRAIVLADPPQGRLIEVSVARYAFHGVADAVEIHGLTIEKYFNPAQEGAISGSGRGWRVENCELRMNTGAGISVGSDSTVSNCAIHHNGQIGATADGSNILFQDNEIWANNIYGFAQGWDAGGIKITQSENIVFRGNHVHRNGGPGLWCDESCVDVTFEHNIVEYNQSAGIFFELSAGAVIHHNTLRENNQAGETWFWGADILIAASQDADIHDNTVVTRDGGRAIMLIDQNRWKVGGGFYRTQRNRVHNNAIDFLGEGAAGGVSVADPKAANFGIIGAGGNRFDQNSYRVLGPRQPVFAWDLEQTDFAGFRRLGQETAGIMAKPAPAPP